MSATSDLDEVVRTLTSRRATELRRRRVSLQVTSGPDAGQRHDFDGTARLGKSTLADLVLRDPKVSGLHCEVVAGDELRVRDLGSKNGSWLGGYRVVEAVVPPGDTIALGDTRVRVVPTAELVDVPLHQADTFHGLVGGSAAMRALTARLERLAGGDTTVLVLGETGTGKERVAEALHVGGKRAAGPLVIVDCGSLPSTLIESELFGHERGAFTGAIAAVAGAFERAHGGTLFLDEIGELPLDLQPKLLRALESREVRRLGGARALPFDARVVAATHRDLQLEVSRGQFREDLYYRLAVVTLTVPPLRERLDDVPLLAIHLLQQLGVDPAACLTVESLATLMAHRWPGNVRELRNTLERAAALAEPIRLSPRADVVPAPTSTAAPSPAIDLEVPLRIAKQRAVDDFERAYIGALLDACGGNISEVARRAGMDRMSIHRIVQRLRLRGPGA